MQWNLQIIGSSQVYGALGGSLFKLRLTPKPSHPIHPAVQFFSLSLLWFWSSRLAANPSQPNLQLPFPSPLSPWVSPPAITVKRKKTMGGPILDGSICKAGRLVTPSVDWRVQSPLCLAPWIGGFIKPQLKHVDSIAKPWHSKRGSIPKYSQHTSTSMSAASPAGKGHQTTGLKRGNKPLRRHLTKHWTLAVQEHYS